MRFLLNSSFGGTYQTCPSHPQRISMISSPPSQTQQPFGSQEVCQGLESSHGWIYVPLQLPDLPHLSLQIKQRWQVKKKQKSRKVEMSLDTSTGLSFKGWKGSLLRNWCKLMQLTPSVSWMDTRHFSISFFSGTEHNLEDFTGGHVWSSVYKQIYRAKLDHTVLFMSQECHKV